MSSKICVIGAGISGITAGKYLRDRGLAYDCFESSSVVGGNWVFKNPNGRSAAYRSLHIDTSKKRLEFPDFPMPEHYPTFCHHSHIREYFESAVDHFGLRDAIRFETPVRRATPGTHGGWRIELDDETLDYDHLIVATGHHWDPKQPDFQGSFDGQILHSHDYIDLFDPIDMRGKRILVVGFGNSAVDIASELSNRGIAERLVLSTRRGAHVIPKYVFGRPVDQVVETIPWLPLGLQRKIAGLLMRLVVGRMESYGLPTPDHALLSAHPTVSSDLLQRAGNGDIAIRPNLERLDGRRVVFVDGESEEFDVILYATGYRVSFPFFDPEFLSAPDNRIALFKRVFLPDQASLMFVGFAQAIPSLIEFVQEQSSWIADHLAGDYLLPPREEMLAAIEKDTEKQGGHYVKTARHTMQVDQAVYAWDLKKERRRGRRRARRAAGHERTADL